MDALAERLGSKLREWKPEPADLVRQRVAEIIEAIDRDGLDILRSRLMEQETLDLIDTPPTRC